MEVRGTGFVQSDGLVCRFGENTVPVAARFVSESLVECRSRARRVAGNVTLEVSINNQDFSSSGVTFEYLGSPAVGMVRPSQGPVGGGTLVEVTGGPFWERSAATGSLYCRFGSQGFSRAQRISDFVIECLAPAHAAGTVLVKVSINGKDFTSGGVAYAFVGPTIRSVTPSMGPERGGTLVLIALTPGTFPLGHSFYCVFGAVPVLSLIHI